MTKTTEAREESRAALLELLPPGSTVYTVLRSVARSGMSRRISCESVRGSEILDITWHVAELLGRSRNRDDGGITVSGCGMDMGHSLIYNLSRTLYPEGFLCSGDSEEWRNRCPSNDHSNGDRDFTPHSHSDGGYALRQVWL